MGYLTSPRPFQGWFVIRGLELARIKLPTKFEVSISSHNEGSKSLETGLGWLESRKVTKNSANALERQCHSIECVRFRFPISFPQYEKMNENARILSAFENRLRAGFV